MKHNTVTYKLSLYFTNIISQDLIMMFKLSMKLDVSLGDILLGVAGFSVAVCAYKYCSIKKREQIASLKSEVVNTSDEKQSISAKSDEKGNAPSNLCKQKVLSSKNHR